MKVKVPKLLNIIFDIVFGIFGFIGCIRQPTITFLIEIPEKTNADDTIYIVGNHEKLGQWKPDKVPLIKKSNNIWGTSIKFPKGTHLEYKITRGSWQTEATDSSGNISGNIVLDVTKDTTVTIRVQNWRDLIPKPQSIVTGNVKYHKNFHATKLNNDRDIVVLLPPSYDKETEKRYPVLYMHDGQNVFDPATSFLGVEWGVDETADTLWKKGEIEEFIGVGIYNTPQRLEEYARTPKGEGYMDFIINDLKPFIDKTYRTLPDRKNTSVMGSSMGGLISFYLVWLHSDVFYQAACLSTSITWGKGDLFNVVKDYTGPKKDIRIYFDHGSIGWEGRNKHYYEKMKELLIEKGFKDNEDIEYFYDEGADHSERSWAKRVWRPLKFMYGKK